MMKQEKRLEIQLYGLAEVKEATQDDYERLARLGIGFVPDDLLHPEVIEAAKQLDLLPKDFVPRVAQKPHYTKEEIEAYQKAAQRYREEARRKNAIRKALHEQRQEPNPSPTREP
ncbi:MAG: hypothetical protein AB7T14_09520 [Candidatus Methylacidiphilaceae bacterium]